MNIEPIGLLTIALGLVGLSLGYGATLVVFIGLTVLGAAAAIIVGAFNIQPAHLFLAFAALAILTKPQFQTAALRSIEPLSAGFWLGCLLIYGVVVGYFVPTLLAGTTQIVPLGASEYPTTGATLPLGPVSSNFTQAIYLAADLLCFSIVAAVGTTKIGFEAITNGVILFTVLNIAFAILDLATDATGTEELLQVIRNASYTFHLNEDVGGYKRIIGSWPEASAFASMTFGPLGFTGTLWLTNAPVRWTGALTMASASLILLSTSSAGLATLPIALLILYMTALAYCGTGVQARKSTIVVLTAPIIVTVATLILITNETLWSAASTYVDTLLISKQTSSSAIERSSWNAAGLQNFFDTLGIGVGLGTVRTSSFPIVLLSNVGVIGTFFYVLFIAAIFSKTNDNLTSSVVSVRLAARNGCLCVLAGSLTLGPTVDQGLPFYILAALACATPYRRDNQSKQLTENLASAKSFDS